MALIKEQRNPDYEQVKGKILKKIGKRKPTEWLNKEYEELSLDIKSKTNVLISPTTLKRIFGKKKTPEKYYPQKATLDALTEYAEAFNDNQKINSILFSRKALITYGILVILIISSFVIHCPKNEYLNEEATLTLQKLEGTTPASAFFEYKIPITEDSLYIDFGDERKSVRLNPENNKITHCYRYPGVLKAKIMRGSEAASKEVDILIPTNGWRAHTYYYWIPHGERFFYPVPIEKVSKNGVFYPPSSFLHSIGIDTTQTIMMQLANFTKTNTSGDSFRFKTRLKGVNFWPGTQCYYT